MTNLDGEKRAGEEEGDCEAELQGGENKKPTGSSANDESTCQSSSDGGNMTN